MSIVDQLRELETQRAAGYSAVVLAIARGEDNLDLDEVDVARLSAGRSLDQLDSDVELAGRRIEWCATLAAKITGDAAVAEAKGVIAAADAHRAERLAEINREYEAATADALDVIDAHREDGRRADEAKRQLLATAPESTRSASEEVTGQLNKLGAAINRAGEDLARVKASAKSNPDSALAGQIERAEQSLAELEAARGPLLQKQQELLRAMLEP